MCITMRPASHRAATSTMAASRNPEMSLMIEAPAATQAFATCAWRVSMLTTHDGSAESAETIGLTRAISSAASSAAEPGRDDSPPTSTIEAPSDTIS
jgi:hypothetical protein